jgi:demethylmenaquinone methyltransferase/2-methoxy-6-polyprenyl-1,4-benzoquinol methylase
MSAATHFGFTSVPLEEKAPRVRAVFDAVASRYDVMNDLMSAGLHRLWKAYTLQVAQLQPGMQVLDIASGTGDLALGFARRVGKQGCVVHTDINEAMLRVGRDRLLNAGVVLPSVVCDAQNLPFESGRFDRVCVAFGLRNMTDKAQALREMRRVLKPDGRLLVLEFSQIAPPLSKLYDAYSFRVLPRLGQWITGDAGPYRYLVESIRMHPDQKNLSALLKAQGFAHADVHNLCAGVAALHVGWNPLLT